MNRPPQPEPFDWKQFERLFGPGFPFNYVSPWQEPESLEQFVQETLEASSHWIRETVRESRNYVHVKLEFPKPLRNPERWRLFAGRQSVSVKGPDGKPLKTIPLPAPVHRTKYMAVFADGELRLRLRKMFVDDEEKELFVEY